MIDWIFIGGACVLLHYAWCQDDEAAFWMACAAAGVALFLDFVDYVEQKANDENDKDKREDPFDD